MLVVLQRISDDCCYISCAMHQQPPYMGRSCTHGNVPDALLQAQPCSVWLACCHLPSLCTNLVPTNQRAQHNTTQNTFTQHNKDLGFLMNPGDGAVPCVQFYAPPSSRGAPSHMLSGSADGSIAVWGAGGGWEHLKLMKVERVVCVCVCAGFASTATWLRY